MPAETRRACTHLVAGGENRTIRLRVAVGGILAGLRTANLEGRRDCGAATLVEREDINLRELSGLGRRRLRRREAENSSTRTREEIPPAKPENARAVSAWPLRNRDSTGARFNLRSWTEPTESHRLTDSSSISGDSVRTAARERVAGAAVGANATAVKEAAASIAREERQRRDLRDRQEPVDLAGQQFNCGMATWVGGVLPGLRRSGRAPRRRRGRSIRKGQQSSSVRN